MNHHLQKNQTVSYIELIMSFSPDSNSEFNLTTPESICVLKEDSVLLSPLTLTHAKWIGIKSL